MTRTKEAVAGVEASRPEDTQVNRELEELNRFSKTPLTHEEVYLFSVRLCDNQVDRDNEYFDRAALEQLAPLFVGKSGIFDHDWTAKYQAARIYRTEVIQESGIVEESGETKCFLKGYAYMLRTEGNQELIAEIEGGIKKEVSVSCAVERSLCSICGNDIQNRSLCSHEKGRAYEGRRCAAKLTDPTDAFEWSFVAVPAQRQSGVMKAMKDWAANHPGEGFGKGLPLERQLEQLEKEAALGRKYLDELRGEVLWLGLLAQKEMKAGTLSAICQKLEEDELLQMKRAYEKTAKERYPLETQLSYQSPPQQEVQEDKVFCI